MELIFDKWFPKTVYWTKVQVEKHKKKLSKSDVGWKMTGMR